jgi:hypothetical protein
MASPPHPYDFAERVIVVPIENSVWRKPILDSYITNNAGRSVL